MCSKKLKRGDRLTLALADLQVGESMSVPYRLFSENSIRSTVVQFKSGKNLSFEVNAKSNVAAIITRLS